jgi:hypothetical protein
MAQFMITSVAFSTSKRDGSYLWEMLQPESKKIILEFLDISGAFSLKPLRHRSVIGKLQVLWKDCQGYKLL